MLLPAETMVGLGETSYDALVTSHERAGVDAAQRTFPRKRVWHLQQKLAIVQESVAAGTSPTEVARRYGISTGLLYTWRKQLLSAATDGFLPCKIVDALPTPSAVMMAPEVTFPAPVADPAPPATPSGSELGTIEVSFAGGARLRIEGVADPATLKLLLDALAPR